MPTNRWTNRRSAVAAVGPQSRRNRLGPAIGATSLRRPRPVHCRLPAYAPSRPLTDRRAQPVHRRPVADPAHSATVSCRWVAATLPVPRSPRAGEAARYPAARRRRVSVRPVRPHRVVVAYRVGRAGRSVPATASPAVAEPAPARPGLPVEAAPPPVRPAAVPLPAPVADWALRPATRLRRSPVAAVLRPVPVVPVLVAVLVVRSLPVVVACPVGRVGRATQSPVDLVGRVVSVTVSPVDLVAVVLRVVPVLVVDLVAPLLRGVVAYPVGRATASPADPVVLVLVVDLVAPLLRGVVAYPLVGPGAPLL
ncbi:hypothetical protein AB0M47_20835, partial [Hamadaea sp. NPDC051192]